MNAFPRALAALTLFAAAAACGGGSGGEAAANEPSSQPAATAEAAAPTVKANGTLVTVYKSPTCGCCQKWVEHMQQAGYQVEVHDMENVQPVKDQHGVTSNLASCHTALVDGYVVEGHVPAEVIQRMLREKPAIAGLAAPGMPRGSPGMEGPVKDRYDIVAFTKDGKTSVYETR
ncbi:MAG TPA: DUF411 domain-containing protein [Longimicrobium sp.]|nr:DUF411 domain-containing protein [Longimicrobium sp.]